MARSKAETLRLVVTLLLAPLRAAELRAPGNSQPREADALWQLGHAAFDTSRALVSPFDAGDTCASRFGDVFHGRRNRELWDGDRPEVATVFHWWDEILAKAEARLSSHSLDETLPEPVKFTAYTVHTLGEAYDYVIYHTSFHLGVAQNTVA
jgi:hypothetical protein